jgi:hypothetical protein
MKITCDAPGCIRGLVHREAWADPCKFCSGQGFITLAELCRRLGENESTVRKLLRPHRKMRSKTAARLLEKIHELIDRSTSA